MKRILSWILVLTLAVGLLPAQVFANQLENQEEQLVVHTEETLAQPEETVAAEEEAIVQPEETVAVETVPEETTAPVPEAVPETEDLAVTKAEFTLPGDKADNDALLGGFFKNKFSKAATYSTIAGDRLSGDEKTIYNALVPIMQELAAGERSSTIVYIGQTTYYDGYYYYPDVSATFKTKEISDAGLARIVNALLSDLPYDMYWYDKVTGCVSESFYNTSTNKMVQFQIAFAVADNYRGSSIANVNTTLAKRASAAARNSADIVDKYWSKTDYEKLLGYKEEICDLVDYDFDAVYYGNFSYDNDPWQLIHVFDGDPTTDVVCEGYSKAFMYLCDQTYFGGDVSCVLATGDMGGPHMWNIVQIAGKNYLVDVTNSESDGVGKDGRLFLAGGSGSIANGYTVGGYKYTYDTDTKNTFGTGTSSMLYLSSKNYDNSVVVAKGKCGKNLNWTLTGTGVLTISGTGAMYDYLGDDATQLNWWGVVKTIVIQEGVTTIGAGAFWCFDELTSVSLPSTLTTIGECAFAECGLLETITIPASVKKIELDAFWYCTNLTGIWVEEGNASFTSDFRGVLYNKDKTKLIAAPALSGGYVIPDGVTTIEQSAFDGSIALAELWIPLSVKTIGYYAFNDYLNDIYYAGTSSQWNNINIIYNGYDWFPNAIMHYSSPHSHTYVNYAGQAATCTEPGWQPYGECSTCGYSSYTVIPAFGHSYTETVTKPTFTSEGYTDFYCTRCGYSYRGNYKAPLELSAPEMRYQSGALEFGEYIEGFVYEIYRSTSKSGSFKLVDEIVAEACRWEDTTGTAGKTYYYKAKAVSNNGAYASVFSKVVSMPICCDEPELTVEAGATGKPVLKWNKVSGAKKYEIHRSIDGGSFKKLTTTTKTTYTDTKATAGAECTYKIKAVASKSTYNSGYSATDSCYVTCAAPSLTVKIDTATGKPSLSWSKVSNATGYVIFRGVNGGEYAYLTTVTGTSYKDMDTLADNQYSYKMQTLGKEDVFNSPLSAAKSVTVTVGQPKLTGTVNDDGKPVITWGAVEDAVLYKVYRSTSATKSYKLVYTTEGFEYTDTSVSAGKSYYYKVLAVGQNSENYSSYIKLTGKCDVPEMTVKAGSTGKPVLTWNKISGAKKYEIWRSVNGAAFKKLTTTTKTTYTDTKATEGAECTYKVKALGSKSSYNSLFSETGSCYVTCAVPTVTAKVDAATGMPTITWKKVTGATAYEICRTTVSTGEKIHVVFETVTVVYDDIAELGEEYTYTVRALGKEDVFNSAESKAYTMVATCAQPKVTGKINSAGKPELTWREVDQATSYVIYRSTSKTKGYKMIDEVYDLSYTDTSAKKGKTYYYKVSAVYFDTQSALSGYVKLKPKK